jgi:hypothetical protein
MKSRDDPWMFKEERRSFFFFQNFLVVSNMPIKLVAGRTSSRPDLNWPARRTTTLKSVQNVEYQEVDRPLNQDVSSATFRSHNCAVRRPDSCLKAEALFLTNNQHFQTPHVHRQLLTSESIPGSLDYLAWDSSKHILGQLQNYARTMRLQGLPRHSD